MDAYVSHCILLKEFILMEIPYEDSYKNCGFALDVTQGNLSGGFEDHTPPEVCYPWIPTGYSVSVE